MQPNLTFRLAGLIIRNGGSAAKSPNFDSFHKTIIFSRGAPPGSGRATRSSGNWPENAGFPL